MYLFRNVNKPNLLLSMGDKTIVMEADSGNIIPNESRKALCNNTSWKPIDFDDLSGNEMTFLLAHQTQDVSDKVEPVKNYA